MSAVFQLLESWWQEHRLILYAAKCCALWLFATLRKGKVVCWAHQFEQEQLQQSPSLGVLRRCDHLAMGDFETHLNGGH